MQHTQSRGGAASQFYGKVNDRFKILQGGDEPALADALAPQGAVEVSNESSLILKVALLVGGLLAAVWTVEWLAGLRKLRLER